MQAIYGAEDTRHIRHGFTDKQRDTIVTALKAGYFGVPRGITMEELADHQGLSHQALSEQLRRATGQLVESTLLTHVDEDGENEKNEENVRSAAHHQQRRVDHYHHFRIPDWVHHECSCTVATRSTKRARAQSGSGIAVVFNGTEQRVALKTPLTNATPVLLFYESILGFRTHVTADRLQTQSSLATIVQ